MTLSRYLLIMSAATLLCWGGWLLVLFRINPLTTGAFGFFSFYAALFLALTGTGAVLGFALRAGIAGREEPRFRHVRKTFRQGLLFSALLLSALILQSQRYLRWWSILFLVLLFVFLELFFLTKKSAY